MKNPLRRQAGLSLVELMIAITLGFVVLLALTTLFANNSRTRAEIERSGRQLENGRYAMQLLSADIRNAGYLGEYYNTSAPGALPDPCATDASSLTTAATLHVQGYDNGYGGLSCLSDVKSGTDVIVVRRASSCSSANPQDSDCDAVVAGLPYLQSSGCSTDASSFRIDTSTSGNLTLKKIGCTNTASLRRFRTHIYYIANNNIGSDGIPTLWRAELGAGSFSRVPLVEGIENMQLQYGVDNNSDGIPDAYTTSPASVSDWYNVMTVNISLLSRNETTSLGYTDNKTYTLAGTTVTPGGSYRRHVYSATVSLVNPIGRR